MTPEEKDIILDVTKLIEAIEPLPHEQRVECLLASIAGQLEILLSQVSKTICAHNNSPSVYFVRTSEMYPEEFTGSNE
jgi:hypothetical protein